MKTASVLVLAFVLHIANGNSPCADIDTEACKLMEHNKSDLCNSSTGETACPRYCGKCPLECFSCPDLVQDISQCNTTVTCDLTQTCYTMEIFDFDGSHGFSGGCIAKELCVPHRGDGQLFGRSSSTVHTQCCDSDRCNAPPASTTTSTTSTTTTHSVQHTTASHHHPASHCVDIGTQFLCSHAGFVCALEPHQCRKSCGLCLLVLAFVLHIANGDSPCLDLDTEACKLMEHSKADLCDSSIGETACPRYCGKCPLECFSCPDLVQDITQCNTVVTCNLNQTCYTMEIFDFDRSHGFSGGCVAKELCVPHRGQSQLFGRSSSMVQTKCCDSDKCNGPSTTTTSTTSATSTTTRHTTHAQWGHRTTASHNCVDLVHGTLCSHRDICSHSYLARECQKTCGLCLSCHDNKQF